MKKRPISLLFALVFAFMAAASAFPAFDAAAVSGADFVAPVVEIPEMLVVPDDDMLSENVSYILGEGTRYEVEVSSLFVDPAHNNREGTINRQLYICVHNSGSYPASAGASSIANYCRGVNTPTSWHYTVGHDNIEQQLPVTEIGYHAGNYSYTDPYTNHNTIGIETCDNGFPADQPAGGQHWDSQEMYEWYENYFDVTATHLAMHVACLCVRLNFNPYTQIIQHNSCSGKECPMEMRYVFGTNPPQFAFEGTYFKVFLDRTYDYYRAFGGSYIETDTVKNEYYNPDKVVYKKGLYRTGAEIKAYRAGNIETGEVGTIAAGSVVDVKIVGYDWGKIVLDDGTAGWIVLKDLTYIGGEYDYGTYRDAAGAIVNVTKIDGNTAYYEGGSADIGTLTRVYKVEVEGDTAFGAEAKYLASGESFEVSAVPPAAPFVFDMWEATKGAASIAGRESADTTVTVLNSDLRIKATYRDKYLLTVEKGSGSGKYRKNITVDIVARAMVGYKFTGWRLVSGEGSFGDPGAFSTTFTMGEKETVITAEFETTGTLDLSGLTNYALGKSYVTTWKGSTDINKYYSDAQSDNSLVKLTDGVRAKGFSTSSSAFVTFMGTGAVATFTIDLTKVYNLSKVVLRDFAANSGSFDDIESKDINVEFSNDGTNFTPAADLTDTLVFSYDIGEDGAVTQYKDCFTHCVDFAQADGSYLRVSFKSKKYCTSISEIEVYGAEGQTGEAPPVPSEEPFKLTEDPIVADHHICKSEDNGFIFLDEGIKAQELASKAFEEGSYLIKESDGRIAIGFAIFKTGMTVQDGAENTITVVVRGDVNGDGSADNLDAALILRCEAGLSATGELASLAGDVNDDGSADNLDASLVLRYEVGLIQHFQDPRQN